MVLTPAVLRIIVSLMAIMVMCGCSEPMTEIYPPVKISCGKDLPNSWEEGGVIDLKSDGSVSLLTPDLHPIGTQEILGVWHHVDGETVATLTHLVLTNGRIVPVTPRASKAWYRRFLVTKKMHAGRKILELHAFNKDANTIVKLKCLMNEQ